MTSYFTSIKYYSQFHKNNNQEEKYGNIPTDFLIRICMYKIKYIFFNLSK